MTRRGYLALGLGVSAEVLAAQQHARDAAANPAGASFSVLTPDETRLIETLTSQIIPTDTSPGAREAGVVYFIDRALATFDAEKKQRYREGLALVNATRAKLFPNITNLTVEQQITL